MPRRSLHNNKKMIWQEKIPAKALGQAVPFSSFLCSHTEQNKGKGWRGSKILLIHQIYHNRHYWNKNASSPLQTDQERHWTVSSGFTWEYLKAFLHIKKNYWHPPGFLSGHSTRGSTNTGWSNRVRWPHAILALPQGFLRRKGRDECYIYTTCPILLHWGRDFSRDEVLFSRVHLKHRLSPVTPLCFQGPVSSCLVRSKPSHTTISSVRMDLSSFFLPMILLLKDCTEYYNVFTNCPTRTTKWDFTKQFIRLPRYNLHFNTATSVSRRDTTNPTVLSKPLISTSVRWDSWEHPSRLRYTVPWFVHKVI